MRKLIEYTLVSLDGVFESPQLHGFMDYRDDAYFRDGLGLLLASDAMLMGRTTYESFASIWPGSAHPWADRLNAIRKYVFSSTLNTVDWNNSTIVRGDVPTEVKKLKQQEGQNLLILGHGLFGETILKHRLLDVLDLSIHPLFLGHGKPLFREGQTVKLNLVASKSFTKGIVKLTYEPHYD